MIKIKKYQVIEIFLTNPSDLSMFTKWNEGIAKIIMEVSRYFALTIFTAGPNKSFSIGYDVGSSRREGSYNSKKYLLTTLENLSFEELKLIMDSDEFYLGFLLILIGKVSDEDIHNLIICNENELVRSGLEFFRMDLDGRCFSWYNPSSITNSMQLFEKLEKKAFL